MPTTVAADVAANRWLVAVALTAVIVLIAGEAFRRAGRARHEADTSASAGRERARRGMRRRAGVLLAVGPAIGLVLAPHPATITVTLAVGAVVLAGAGALIERDADGNLTALAAAGAAGVAAVAAGARFGPTGVDGLDVALAFVVVVAVVKAVDGLGNADGLTPGLGLAATLGLFGIAAFAHQDGLATVLAAFGGGTIAFLAYNLRPASLFSGRAGRLVTGWMVAVGALAVHPVPGAARRLLTPTIVLALLLLDAVVVVGYRLRRRRPLWVHRGDHLLHRLGALGWTVSEGVIFLVVAQLVLAAVALFVARAVAVEWVGAGIAAIVVAVVAVEAGRARLDRGEAPGVTLGVKLTVVALAVALVAVLVPVAVTAPDAVDLMKTGKDAASRGLAAARDGDTITARGDFNTAARTFGQARDKLESKLLSGGLAVPFAASNVRAARTLADVGTDLADAGESVALAVDPDALTVVDGRLPLETIATLTPKLVAGSQTLTRSLRRIDAVRRDPYLAGPVRDAIDKVHGQLARAEREARHAADASRLASAIFGGQGQRTYLLVVQNNAESRATGGFIGSYALMTAVDGKLHVGDVIRTATWNNAVRAAAPASYSAPADYHARYDGFRPDTTLQNINFSPDFPSVAEALMSLAPSAGLPKVDGVLSVDPAGLAALLQLTGPVQVAGWPTPIDSGNVVQVTLRDAYVAYERTPERADFLGDVAKAAVDKATTGELGKPAQIAKVLGQAAHAGHLSLAFARPDEQRLAVQLGVAQDMAPVTSDALALTTSNAAGNKIDYYFQRSVDYRVALAPERGAHRARATSELMIDLQNQAPATGLPEAIIGPFDARFYAGENRSYMSVYTPLTYTRGTVDGEEIQVAPSRERGRNVYSRFADIPAKATDSSVLDLAGTVALHDGWYSLSVRAQPVLNPDRLHVSVDVPSGWRIDRAPGMTLESPQRASIATQLNRTTTYRVHVVRDPATWDLWQRLVAGV